MKTITASGAGVYQKDLLAMMKRFAFGQMAAIFSFRNEKGVLWMTKSAEQFMNQTLAVPMYGRSVRSEDISV